MLQRVQVGHSDYVVSVANIPSVKCPIVPGMGLVSGSRDMSVNVWDVSEGAAVQMLKGTQSSGERGGCGCSKGVWFHVAWMCGKVVYRVHSLREHKAAIMSLCVLSSRQILTGVAAFHTVFVRSPVRCI
jgi:WD40 repeat protein